MSDGLKSVAVVVAILFVYVVVLGGEFEDRDIFGIPIGGRPTISFCESLGDVPVVGVLPCFLINLTVLAATLGALILVFGAGRRLLRRGSL